MVRVSIELVVLLAACAAAIAVLGLAAAVASKAARDVREARLRARTRATAELLAAPAKITTTHLRTWCRSGGLHRVAILRAVEQAAAQTPENVGDSVPHRDELVACLSGQIHSGSAPQRGTALLLLGQLARPEDAPFIAQAAGDPDLDVRVCAIWALGRSTGPAAFDALLELLADPYGVAITPLERDAIIQRLAAARFSNELDSAASGPRAAAGGPVAAGLDRALELSDGVRGDRS